MPVNKDEALDPRLVKGLEAIFDHLKKRGLMTQKIDGQKNDIIHALAKTLTGKLEPSDLKDPLVQMRLMGAMLAKGLGNKGLEKIFTNALENNPKEKASALDKMLLLTFFMLKLQKDNPAEKLEPKSVAEKLLDTFKSLVLRKHGKKELEKEGFEEKTSNAKDPLADTLALYYGGSDPRVAGKIPSVLLAAVTCEPAWTNSCIPDPNSCANMVEEITLNSNKMDYTGKENTLMIGEIINGITNLDELQYATKNMPELRGAPSPLKTTPHP